MQSGLKVTKHSPSHRVGFEELFGNEHGQNQGHDKFMKLLSSYKFYISFENSDWCQAFPCR